MECIISFQRVLVAQKLRISRTIVVQGSRIYVSRIQIALRAGNAVHEQQMEVAL